MYICAHVCASNAFPWGDESKGKKGKTPRLEACQSDTHPSCGEPSWSAGRHATPPRRPLTNQALTRTDTESRKDEWVTGGHADEWACGRARLKRADVRTTPRAALNANTGSLNATKSIRKTITRRRRRIYTLPFVEDDTNWGLLLMVIILSVGGCGFLTGPLLLRVLRASPKAELWFHAQPEKSKPIISALNINLDRRLISWPLLS